MKGQRGAVLLLALGLSLLMGLLAAQTLYEAQLRQRLVSEQVAGARAFEQAEAGLLEGAALLPDALAQRCAGCLPPAIPPDAPPSPWRRTDSAFILLQNLGRSQRAAGLLDGEEVTLVRVTAISQSLRGRRVLEAVYALGDTGVAQRVSWRQRQGEG